MLIHGMMREPAIIWLHSWVIYRRHTHVRVIIRGLRRLLIHRIHIRGDLLLRELWERFYGCNWLKFLLVSMTGCFFVSFMIHWSFRFCILRSLWLNLFIWVYSHGAWWRIPGSWLRCCFQGWWRECHNDILTWKSPSCQQCFSILVQNNAGFCLNL